MILKADSRFIPLKDINDITGKIINGDCMKILPLLPQNSCNLCLTDPPWNKKKDYGVYKDNLSEEEYREFIKKFINISSTICQNKFAIILGSSVLRNWWNILPNSHPVILKINANVRSQNLGMSYQWKALLVNLKTVLYCYDIWTDIRWPGEGYFYRDERFGHPGMTPWRLGTRALKYFSNENDIILDPFCGVGSIPLACEKMGRRWIGIEINPEYCKIAEERIMRFRNQGKLF